MRRFFRREILGHGLAERLLLLWAAIVRQAAIKVGEKGLRGILEAKKRRLGLMQLLVGQAGDGGPKTGVALKSLNFEQPALGFGIGSGLEISPDALAVYAAIDTENDLPGGIRELRNDERIGFIHA